MKDAMLRKWEQIKETCEALNHAGWTGAWKSEETAEMGRRALDAMQEKGQRVWRVLSRRYGIEAK